MESKALLQSYIVTTARYEFDVYQKRLFYRIIEMLQPYFEGQKLNAGYSINANVFNDLTVKIPLSSILHNEEDKNHAKAKKSLQSLASIVLTIDNENTIDIFHIIYKIKIHKNTGVVEFNLDNEVVKALTNFTKGFSKYDLAITMRFKSVYSMRLYELMNNQKNPLTFKIEMLKEMFNLQGKYKNINDFVKKVIIPAKLELDTKSPNSFDYILNVAKFGKIETITFIPKITGIVDELASKALAKRTSIYFDLESDKVAYLKDGFGFNDTELKNNRKLLNKANKSIDLLGLLSELKGVTNRMTNPKAYVIGAIKKAIETKIITPQNTNNEIYNLATKLTKK
jgi:hypothetical protein